MIYQTESIYCDIKDKVKPDEIDLAIQRLTRHLERVKESEVNQAKRKEGLYWVRVAEKWMVARFHIGDTSRGWINHGDSDIYLDEIDERIIERQP